MNEVSMRSANAVDSKILQYAGSHSPEEISYMLRPLIISPERIMARTQELLKSKNWLDLAQNQQRLHLVLQDMLSKIQSQFLDKDNAKIILGTVKELFSQTERMGRATEDDLNKLYGNQGLIMARVVDTALSYMRGAFREEIDPERWDAALAEALTIAQAEIAKHTEAIEA